MRFKSLAFFSCLTRKKTQATPMGLSYTALPSRYYFFISERKTRILTSDSIKCLTGQLKEKFKKKKKNKKTGRQFAG